MAREKFQEMMSGNELRKKFLEFFEKREHKVVSSSSLLSDDPSVLLTTAGMQQFKPYFTGAADPVKDFGSKNTVSIQKSFRTSDIDSVGDESHLTFFEMLGNFSFGGYFKEGAIKYSYEFIVKELGLEIEYVSVFKGDSEVPADTESEKIWQSIGITDIRKMGRKENFWGPTGSEGPCGPTTEIYIRDVEIWNLVFNEYYCHANGTLEKLKTPGVDTGMGLERLAMVVQNKTTIFETDLFAPIVELLPAGLSEKDKRIIADHARAIAFLISDGVRPAKDGAGAVLRRLMSTLFERRYESVSFKKVFENIDSIYGQGYPELNKELIIDEFEKEKEEYHIRIEKSRKDLQSLKKKGIGTESIPLRGFEIFGISSTLGARPTDVFELAEESDTSISPTWREEYQKAFQEHQEISRAGVEQRFKGGLADHDPRTIRLHTAHHLLLAALQQVLGPQVKQRGSHITSKRLRIDFSHSDKLTEEQLKNVENLVNQKIEEGLEVVRKEMPREEAKKIGAEMEFGAKYPDVVSVYFIQDKKGNVFSKEFCGGPHVQNTREIGQFKILKEEASGAGVRRIRATVE